MNLQPELANLVAPIATRPRDPSMVRALDMVASRFEEVVGDIRRQIYGGVDDPMDADVMDLLTQMGPWVPSEHQWPEQLAALYDVMLAYSARTMPAERAAIDARDRVVVIAEYFGGRNLYMPSNDQLRMAVRDAMLFQLQGVVPTDELMRRFGLTAAAISMICTEQRKLRVRRMQGDLFNGAAVTAITPRNEEAA